MSDEDFKIKSEIFEGPISLLLNLIEDRKLHISEFSLSEVTDSYIKYIEDKTMFSIQNNSEFIFIASTLLLIKSKSLLPTLDLTREEEFDVSNLEKRLVIYKFYCDLGKRVAGEIGVNNIYFKKPRVEPPVFTPDRGLNISKLHSAILTILNALPQKVWHKPVSIRKTVSLEDEMNKLSKRLESAIKMRFSEYSKSHSGERHMVIISFIAILELIKRGIIIANQNSPFEEIEMENISINVPNYK